MWGPFVMIAVTFTMYAVRAARTTNMSRGPTIPCLTVDKRNKCSTTSNEYTKSSNEREETSNIAPQNLENSPYTHLKPQVLYRKAGSEGPAILF